MFLGHLSYCNAGVIIRHCSGVSEGLCNELGTMPSTEWGLGT